MAVEELEIQLNLAYTLTRFIYDHQDTVTAGKAIVIRSLDLNSSPVGIDAEVEE